MTAPHIVDPSGLLGEALAEGAFCTPQLAIQSPLASTW